MKSNAEELHMKQALWTVERLEKMEKRGLSAEEVTQQDINDATGMISAYDLRLAANAAMGRVLEAGGPIADLFEVLYSGNHRQPQTSAAVARTVIRICELRIEELKGTRTNED